jgi:hypothetical protein
VAKFTPVAKCTPLDFPQPRFLHRQFIEGAHYRAIR